MGKSCQGKLRDEDATMENARSMLAYWALVKCAETQKTARRGILHASKVGMGWPLVDSSRFGSTITGIPRMNWIYDYLAKLRCVVA